MPYLLEFTKNCKGKSHSVYSTQIVHYHWRSTLISGGLDLKLKRRAYCKIRYKLYYKHTYNRNETNVTQFVSTQNIKRGKHSSLEAHWLSVLRDHGVSLHWGEKNLLFCFWVVISEGLFLGTFLWWLNISSKFIHSPHECRLP